MSRQKIHAKRFPIMATVLAMTLLVGSESAFSQQELKVGFITGRGTDAAVERQALEAANIEYEEIGPGDYTLARLSEFDVIAVGVVAYDQNEGLKANFSVLNQYVLAGGYLAIIEFQQDSTWNAGFLPLPLQLFDDDLNDDIDVVLADHPIWKIPNEITTDHFAAGVWGAGDFMADAPHSVSGAWEVLLSDTGNNWPLVAGGPAGRGYVVFNSLQTLQSLGRAGNELVGEVLENLLFWKGLLIPKGIARKPVPASDSPDVSRDMDLSWEPGGFAATHNVYFGTSPDDVNDATVGDPGGVLGAQGLTDLSLDPGRLDFGQTYYWRVDEVNAAPDFAVHKGVLWSFTAEPFSVPVGNITATSASAFGLSLPENTVNGSGLDGDLHSTSAADMWISAGIPATIEYAFDKAYKLDELWIWNSNQLIEAFVGFGAKDVVIETSVDGQTWQTVEGVGPLAQAPGVEGYAPNNTVALQGATARFVRITVNSVQGIAPQASLSEVRFFAIPTSASRPNPEDGATDVAPDAPLMWGRNGRKADRHEVYLGSDPGALALAGSISESSLATEGLDLQLDQTYHWRVDEVNEAMDPSTWEGSVWRFTTVSSLVLDDMESYADAEFLEIWATWIDGFDDPANGSLAGGAAGTPETVIVHTGDQSMPLDFDNSTAQFSEATRTFEQTQDWTRSGVQTLVLFFHGSDTNTGGGLYVKINDTRVAYDGDPANLTAAGWNEWRIPLAAMAGTDLSAVTSLTIGVDGGGEGVVYIDDIVLDSRTP